MLYYLLIFETRREDMESLRDKVKERVLAVERILQEHYSSPVWTALLIVT